MRVHPRILSLLGAGSIPDQEIGNERECLYFIKTCFLEISLLDESLQTPRVPSTPLYWRS